MRKKTKNPTRQTAISVIIAGLNAIAFHATNEIGRAANQ